MLRISLSLLAGGVANTDRVLVARLVSMPSLAVPPSSRTWNAMVLVEAMAPAFTEM